MDTFLSILSRFLHIIPAMVVFGGLLFMRVILPAALERSELSAEAREAVFLKCRRIFKIKVHVAITLLLISGVYNAWRLFPQYQAHKSVLYGFWHTHMLLGVIVIGISIYMLKGERPPGAHRTLAATNLALLLVLILLASSLKQLRERYHSVPPPQRAASPS